VDTIAWHFWKQDVAKSLVFQWFLLAVVSGACAVWSGAAALSALCAGCAIAIPNTALGAWMGLKIVLGQSSPLGVLLGGVVKTLLSVVLIGAAFAALQEFGWVWQGFFAGLVGTVFAPLLFGLFAKNKPNLK
jgi:F0F1-type ATP synthase assembly protein I